MSFDYHRLDVYDVLSLLGMDDRKAEPEGEKVIEKLEAVTSKYLAQESVKAEIRSIATFLVNKGRLENANAFWWGPRTSGIILYRCPVIHCSSY